MTAIRNARHHDLHFESNLECHGDTKRSLKPLDSGALWADHPAHCVHRFRSISLLIVPQHTPIPARPNKTFQLARTVSGAAPTAGSELIRKRSPSGETAY